ncbi:MAG: metallophosphoesterase [Nanoarchaeota archaeon]
MAKKTRILAIGDIHGDTGLVKRLAKMAKDEKVDIIILPGDLTLLEHSTKNLIGPFIKENKKVLIMPGNHETMVTIDFLTQVYPNTKNIHGIGIKEKDIGIFGVGYADAGPFSINDKEVAKALEKGYAQIKNMKKKIMVTHSHHAGSKAEFTGFSGSKAIRKAIEKFQPDLVLSAHIHEAGGIEEQIGKTRIINVARKPVIFDI